MAQFHDFVRFKLKVNLGDISCEGSVLRPVQNPRMHCEEDLSQEFRGILKKVSI